MGIAIEFKNLTKEFPGIIANNNINISIKKGEIHALLGENGAGKSTLMSILFGIYKPTYGKIKLNDVEINIRDPFHANDLGIGMVHQHFKLVDNFTNLQNIILGSEIEKNHILDIKSAKEKIKIYQEKYKLYFDLDQKTEEATVSTKQKLEIIKMLYRDAEILIFDEPTAVLAPSEIDSLMSTIKEMKENGKTIIFISHKLDEVLKIADRASVLRKGELIKTFDSFEGLTKKDITNAMVGNEIIESKNNNAPIGNEVVLSFKNVYKNILKKASFNINKGEIFAFAGVEGNGQEEIEYIASQIISQTAGEVLLNGKKISKLKRSELLNLISYVPGDRLKYGLSSDFNVNDNSILRNVDKKEFNSFTILKQKNIKSFSNRIIEEFDVRGARDGNAMSKSLSGGNQQKAVVGREIESEHDLLIIVQPTRGLDVGAIKLIHDYILREKNLNKAVLLISYELDEVIALADTIAVINKGVIQDIKPAKELSREQIGLLMVGNKKIEVKNE